MFNFLKKEVLESSPILSVEKIKTTKEIIEEIHDSFYTEVDRLLEEAKISKSIDTDKQDLIDKCERLKKLGFSNAKEVKEAEVELERLHLLKIENENNRELIEAINYFSFKYPNYKFITEDSVKKICEKYNLIYGTIDKYIGEVPNKNLKHIEDFKIDENDECWNLNTIYGMRSIYEENIHKNDSLADEKIAITNSYSHPMKYMVTKEKCKLEIAAPLKDFDMTDQELKGFKLSDIEIPDPVVLQPVLFKKKKHYLIITAWGLEASDELVVNHKFN